MAFDPATVTVEQLDAELTAICETHPTWRNPTAATSNRCVYSAPGGEHCLIGHWLADRGIFPRPLAWSADHLLRRLKFTLPVAARAADWQDAADRSRCPWGDVPALVL